MSQHDAVTIGAIIQWTIIIVVPIWASIRLGLLGAIGAAILLWLVIAVGGLAHPPRPTLGGWLLFGWMFTFSYTLLVYGIVRLFSRIIKRN